MRIYSLIFALYCRIIRSAHQSMALLFCALVVFFISLFLRFFLLFLFGMCQCFFCLCMCLYLLGNFFYLFTRFSSQNKYIRIQKGRMKKVKRETWSTSIEDIGVACFYALKNAKNFFYVLLFSRYVALFSCLVSISNPQFFPLVRKLLSLLYSFFFIVFFLFFICPWLLFAMKFKKIQTLRFSICILAIQGHSFVRKIQSNERFTYICVSQLLFWCRIVSHPLG